MPRVFNSPLVLQNVNPLDKKYAVANMSSRPYEEIAEEADKCVLLCRLCHQIFEAGFWECVFIKSSGLGWLIKEGSVIEHLDRAWPDKGSMENGIAQQPALFDLEPT